MHPTTIKETLFCPILEQELFPTDCTAVLSYIQNPFSNTPLSETKKKTITARQSYCARCIHSPFVQQNNARLTEAICFAAQRHSHQLRKGTVLPYILHPLEVMQILSTMQAGPDLLIAGVLHDIIEDTDTTLSEIQDRFGETVAHWVAHHSEDKTQLWLSRKTQAIEDARLAEHPLQMLILADKLSNLRAIARDYQQQGDTLWTRFHAPKEKQAWYYNGILSALQLLEQFEDTSAAYQEAIHLYKDVFVLYKITPTYDKLYQANTFGETYVLTKGNPQWVPTTYRFRQNDLPLTRQEAESLEDKWYDLFLNVVELDLQDAIYPLLSSPNQTISFSIQHSCLSIQYSGQVQTFSEEDTYDFFYQLRLQFGIHTPLATLLVEQFGGAQGAEALQHYLRT